jgi:hypothetical protein
MDLERLLVPAAPIEHMTQRAQGVLGTVYRDQDLHPAASLLQHCARELADLCRVARDVNPTLFHHR